MTMQDFINNWGIVIAVAIAVAIALLALVAAIRNSDRASMDVRIDPMELSDDNSRPMRLDYRELRSGAREEFLTQWRIVRGRFGCSPDTTIIEADALAQLVLAACNIPRENLTDVKRALPAEMAAGIDEYQHAHAVRLDVDEGRATAADLRRAMSFYDAMMGRLLDRERELEHAM